MNEKFFDLKKEKQDRIINAALKIFAQNGYRHASTDDIVREAGISKGLLFHYFGSKLGLYTFLYDYCVRFLSLELTTSVGGSESDYFKIMTSIENAKSASLKNYPFIQMFIDTSAAEDDDDAVDATLKMRTELQSTMDKILTKVDSSKFKSNIDPAAIHSMLTYTLRGIMTEQLQAPLFNAELYHNEAIRYIEMLHIMSY